jgi:hypothetical protein
MYLEDIMETETKLVKLLYDFNILQWGLTGFAENSYYMLGANTVLRKNLGIEFFEDRTDNYRVQASASKHLIGLHRSDREHFGVPLDKLELKDEIFFKGVIAVYNKDELLQDGPIWTAFKLSDKFSQEDGLSKVIFNDAKTDKEKDTVIEAIVNAYVEREIAIEHEKLHAQHNSFQNGEQSGAWKKRHGYRV